MKKILLIEDDIFLVKVYSKLLEKEGFKTIYLQNGKDALAVVKREKPDLIVLDLVMPVRDGFLTIEDLKKDEEVKDVPIITLSVLGMKEDVDRVIKLGVKKHLLKTKYTFNQIVSIITDELS